jgi:NADPH2:quinone reductase
MEFLAQKTREKTLTPSIARVLPLRDTAEGHRLLEDREVQGTIVVDTTHTSAGWLYEVQRAV